MSWARHFLNPALGLLFFRTEERIGDELSEPCFPFQCFLSTQYPSLKAAKQASALASLPACSAPLWSLSLLLYKNRITTPVPRTHLTMHRNKFPQRPERREENETEQTGTRCKEKTGEKEMTGNKKQWFRIQYTKVAKQKLMNKRSTVYANYANYFGHK